LRTVSLFFALSLSFQALAGFAKTEHPSLKQKLELQWQHYNQARQTLLAAVANTKPPELRIVSRETWEKILTLQGEEAFNTTDLDQLRRDQFARALAFKNKAIAASVIDLNEVRAQKKAAQFCSRLPKGGMLHIHPWGTVDRSTAALLLKQNNPALDFTDIFKTIEQEKGNTILYPQEQSWLLNIQKGIQYSALPAQTQLGFQQFLFLPPGKHPFPRFNGVFPFLNFAIQDWATYHQVLLAFAQKAVQQGVSYVELTTYADEELFKHLAEIEKQTGLIIRTNFSFARTESLSNLDQQWRKLQKAPRSEYLVGIDFLDNEETNPALEKGQLLYGSAMLEFQAGTSPLRRTMHAGEIGDTRNTRDAMIMGAERLGHGVNLVKDTIALEYAAKVKMPVEINLTSNLRLTNIPSLETHPYLFFLRLGLPVSLSTDDEGIFDTDINHECQLAIEHSDVSYYELKKMAANSIRTSFAKPEVKVKLLKKLNAAFLKFEADYRR
jgi:adenosine deaminase CECR1